VPQDLISGLLFPRIDFGGWLQSSPGCRPCPAKPLSCYNVFV